jgi:hypothetical protein
MGYVRVGIGQVKRWRGGRPAPAGAVSTGRRGPRASCPRGGCGPGVSSGRRSRPGRRREGPGRGSSGVEHPMAPDAASAGGCTTAGDCRIADPLAASRRPDRAPPVWGPERHAYPRIGRRRRLGRSPATGACHLSARPRTGLDTLPHNSAARETSAQIRRFACDPAAGRIPWRRSRRLARWLPAGRCCVGRANRHAPHAGTAVPAPLSKGFVQIRLRAGSTTAGRGFEARIWTKPFGGAVSRPRHRFGSSRREHTERRPFGAGVRASARYNCRVQSRRLAGVTPCSTKPSKTPSCGCCRG